MCEPVRRIEAAHFDEWFPSVGDIAGQEPAPVTILDAVLEERVVRRRRHWASNTNGVRALVECFLGCSEPGRAHARVIVGEGHDRPGSCHDPSVASSSRTLASAEHQGYAREIAFSKRRH